jgi:hypothetical protein
LARLLIVPPQTSIVFNVPVLFYARNMQMGNSQEAQDMVLKYPDLAFSLILS